MSGDRREGTGVVVRHKVPEVKVLVHPLDIQFLVVVRSSRAGDGQEEALGVLSNACGVLIEPVAKCLEQLHILLGFLRVLRILPINVKTVKAAVLDQSDRSACKRVDLVGGVGARREAGAVGPAADGKQDMKLAVSLLEQKELLEAAVNIGPARVVP